MRAEGIVLGAGDPNQGGLGLPMDEREDRHEVRARMEAKRGRTSSPWADREAPAPGTKEQKAARNARSHDPAREHELFESKPLAAAPTPAPASAPVKAARTKPLPSSLDPAPIVGAYIEGVTIAALASKHRVTKTVIRDLLAATPGVKFRPADLAAPRNRDDDPGLVDAVRRLYELEGLSQREIGDRYGWSAAKVSLFMGKHGIEARSRGGRPRPVLDLPAAPPVAMLPLAAPPARQLTPEQQQVAEALGREITDAFNGLARIVTDVVAEIVKALAGPPTETQDDYTLAQGPK